MLSIIIPTLNEEKYLRKTVLHTMAAARYPQGLELIIIDAGSTDNTLRSIEDLPLATYSMPEFLFKKHQSLNFGIEKSAGEIVMFLDADTLLPKNFDAHIKSHLKDPDIVAGAFEFAFDQPDWKLRLITLANRIRYRFGNVFYGDQAVFARRAALTRIGGVPDQPLMETAFLCKRLRKHGRLTIVRPALKTSPRRFSDHGFFKVAWFDINMFIRFNLGLPVSDYATAYWSKNLRTT